MRLSLYRPTDAERTILSYRVPPGQWAAAHNVGGYGLVVCGNTAAEAVRVLRDELKKRIDESPVDIWRIGGLAEEYSVEDKLDTL